MRKIRGIARNWEAKETTKYGVESRRGKNCAIFGGEEKRADVPGCLDAWGIGHIFRGLDFGLYETTSAKMERNDVYAPKIEKHREALIGRGINVSFRPRSSLRQ